MDISKITKEQLKSELRNHDISFPAGDLKKEVYIDLYKQHLMKDGVLNGNGGIISAPSAQVYSSDSETDDHTTTKNSKQAGNLKLMDNARGSSDIDVFSLSDDELRRAICSFGEQIGPILGSTRTVYERKLQKLLSSASQNAPENKVPTTSKKQAANDNLTAESPLKPPKIGAAKQPSAKAHLTPKKRNDVFAFGDFSDDDFLNEELPELNGFPSVATPSKQKPVAWTPSKKASQPILDLAANPNGVGTLPKKAGLPQADSIANNVWVPSNGNSTQVDRSQFSVATTSTYTEAVGKNGSVATNTSAAFSTPLLESSNATKDYRGSYNLTTDYRAPTEFDRRRTFAFDAPVYSRLDSDPSEVRHFDVTPKVPLTRPELASSLTRRSLSTTAKATESYSSYTSQWAGEFGTSRNSQMFTAVKPASRQMRQAAQNPAGAAGQFLWLAAQVAMVFLVTFAIYFVFTKFTQEDNIRAELSDG